MAKHIYISDSCHDKLKHLAAAENRSLTAEVEHLVMTAGSEQRGDLTEAGPVWTAKDTARVIGLNTQPTAPRSEAILADRTMDEIMEELREVKEKYAALGDGNSAEKEKLTNRLHELNVELSLLN